LKEGKPLTPDLQRILGQWMSIFLETSIEMAFMFGFIVFVHCLLAVVKVPQLLPLGSFFWGIDLVTDNGVDNERDA
jgi:hypothetical protein